MCVTASNAADASGQPKNCIVEPGWSSGLISTPPVENRSHKSLELIVFVPQLHLQNALPAMKQDGVLKSGPVFAFNRRQGVTCDQQLISGFYAEHLQSHETGGQHYRMKAVHPNGIDTLKRCERSTVVVHETAIGPDGRDRTTRLDTPTYVPPCKLLVLNRYCRFTVNA